MNNAHQPFDPSLPTFWDPLRLLQEAMGEDLARIYAEKRIEGLKPSHVGELLHLYAKGPMTITELAESVGRTHSALSQKVAAMRRGGWVQTAVGDDARTKNVALTDKALAVIDKLEAEWQATEAAAAELDAELPYPLTRVVADLQEALARRSFHDRVADKLAENPAWA